MAGLGTVTTEGVDWAGCVTVTVKGAAVVAVDDDVVLVAEGGTDNDDCKGDTVVVAVTVTAFVCVPVASSLPPENIQLPVQDGLDT